MPRTHVVCSVRPGRYFILFGIDHTDTCTMTHMTSTEYRSPSNRWFSAQIHHHHPGRNYSPSPRTPRLFTGSSFNSIQFKFQPLSVSLILISRRTTIDLRPNQESWKARKIRVAVFWGRRRSAYDGTDVRMGEMGDFRLQTSSVFDSLKGCFFLLLTTLAYLPHFLGSCHFGPFALSSTTLVS